MEREEVLAEAQSEIIRCFGRSVRCQIHADMLVLHCEASGADIAITVDDPSRPSFCVSYPGFDPEASSWRDVQERAARNVLLQALLWIVRAVEKDGAVLPEFPKPGLRKSARRVPGS
jgi:hypothetical protein